MNSWAFSWCNRVWVLSKVCFCLLAFSLLLLPQLAFAQIATTDSVSFFTNLSARLLQSELGLNLNWIQVYPTNQYTPAVHRLLQVAANIWDAQTNRQDAFGPLPTVFAPRFTVSNNAVFITGYVEVQTTNDLSALPPFDLSVSTNLPAGFTTDRLIYGVPLVVGARKGLPNFNEYAMESVFTITRAIELVKAAPGGQSQITQTNQFFTMNVSLASAPEFWNSYRSNYDRPVDIVVNSFVTLALSNDIGVTLVTNKLMSSFMQTNTWSGWQDANSNDRSFMVPLRADVSLIQSPFHKYLPGSGIFVNVNTPGYDVDPRLLFPRWFLSVTNRIQAMVVESDTGRIIDYVLLGSMNSYTDFAYYIGQDPTAGDPANPFKKLWGTNSIGMLLSGRAGVEQQIQASKGNFSATASDWSAEGSFTGNRPFEIAKFKAFFTPNHQATYVDSETQQTYMGTNGNLRAYAPYNPSVTITVPMSWQANDPLVHYLASDMLYVEASGQPNRIQPPGDTNLLAASLIKNIGFKNKRYKPWPIDPGAVLRDPEAFNLSIKDPLVRSSDDWRFPTNGCPTHGELSQIHRGTPWQTVYLKSADVDSLAWRSWTGNRDMTDAQHTRPVRDWPLAALIAALINTNPPNQLLSVNNTDPNAWLRVLDDLTALTNVLSDAQLSASSEPRLDPLTVSSNSPQAGIVVASIFATRASQPGGVVRELGDLLGASALSEASPWLNQSSSTQLQRGISDEAYERIPAQLISRLRPDSTGTISRYDGDCQVQFTGFDHYPYAVESSTNLMNWFSVSTNYPTNGVIAFTNPPAATSQYYRSRLLP